MREENRENSKIVAIIPYSFVLCVLVCMIHNSTSSYFEYNGRCLDDVSHYILQNIVPNIYTVAVPSFFILSAYLFYRNYTIDKTLEKYKSRFFSLVIPYLLWNAISLLIEMAIQISPASAFAKYESNPFSVVNILSGIFLSKYNIFWFMLALILYNFFCFGFYYLLKNKFIGILSILVVVMLVCDEYLVIRIPGCHFETTSLIYYMLGAYLGIHKPRFLTLKCSFQSTIVAAMGFCLLVWIEIVVSSMNAEVMLGITFLKVYFLWLIMHFISGKIKISWWMSITFFIYATHQILERIYITVTRVIYNYLGITIPMIEMIIFVTSLGLTIYTCIVLAKVCKKWFPRCYSIITGARG